MHRVFFILLWDWSKKLAQLPQPIRCKTKTNSRHGPTLQLKQPACFNPEFPSASRDVSLAPISCCDYVTFGFTTALDSSWHKKCSPLLKKRIRKTNAFFLGVGSHELFQTFNQDALTYTFVIFAVFLFQSRNEQTVGSRAIWADGLILVYSITDRKSFEEIQHLHNLIDPFKQKTVVIIFGNKSDLEHKRQVPEKEAASLAEKLQCSFFEGSASEGHTKISEAFHELYKEVAKRKKERKVSLSPRPLRNALGKVFRRNSSKNLLLSPSGALIT